MYVYMYILNNYFDNERHCVCQACDLYKITINNNKNTATVNTTLTLKKSSNKKTRPVKTWNLATEV